MAASTLESEQRLSHMLVIIENRKRCEWCGDDRRQIGPRSKLCASCKDWRRRERQAIEWKRKFPSRADHKAFYHEYCIQFASLCRKEGETPSWSDPVSTLDLERELDILTEHIFGGNIFGATTPYFGHFNPAQRRLLWFFFRRMTKTWARQRRRGFAIEAAVTKFSKH